MFSQQKKFYQKKGFYAALAVCVFSFGLWMNTSMKPADSKTAMKNTASQQQVKQVSEYNRTDSSDVKSEGKTDSSKLGESDPGQMSGVDDPQPSSDDTDASVPDMKAEPPYYFIQAQDGLVKIFYYDDGGQGKLVRTTSISFSLLSDIDQQLLEDGIVRHTEEEMNEFLQDYES